LDQGAILGMEVGVDPSHIVLGCHLARM